MIRGITERWRDQPWIGPEVIGASIIFLWVTTGMITRSFSLIALALILSPVFILIMLACFGWSVAHERGARTVPLGLMILAVTVPLARPIQEGADVIGAAIWSLLHPTDLAAAKGKNAVLILWSEWGWAGDSNSTYVIADSHDASASVDGVDRWSRRMKMDCTVVPGWRVWPGLYLVDTNDCMFALKPLKR